MGDKLIISTIKFNIQGARRLENVHVRPFVVAKLHGPNSVEFIMTEKSLRKHSTFAVSLPRGCLVELRFKTGKRPLPVGDNQPLSNNTTGSALKQFRLVKSI